MDAAVESCLGLEASLCLGMKDKFLSLHILTCSLLDSPPPGLYRTMWDKVNNKRMEIAEFEMLSFR